MNLKEARLPLSALLSIPTSMALDRACERLRGKFKGAERVTKSEVTEIALTGALYELKISGKNSRLWRQLKEKREGKRWI